MPMSTLTCTSESALLVRTRAVVWVRRAGTSPDVVPLPASAGVPNSTSASSVARAPHRARTDTPCAPLLVFLRNDARRAPVTGGGVRLGVAVGEIYAISANLRMSGRGRREPRLPALHLLAVRRLSAELAEHSDRAEGDAVDEQVRRRQVQLPAELVGGGARVAEPHRLVPQPLAAEAERRLGDRLEQRHDVLEHL